jgi:protein RecA
MEVIRGNKPKKLSDQMKEKLSKKEMKEVKEYDGNFGTIISTGSTLLDLAISGGRIRGGGLPGGVLVEIFGPASSGKTVLLSEIAGNVQRQGGEVMFKDPEARLNKQFAKMFGLEIKEKNYAIPNTVTEVFKEVREWIPENNKKNIIHGVFADSLAALSTDMEMEKNEGDKMGMKRAKEFSEELRKTCRILSQKNYLIVCSNQIRVNMDAGLYGQKYISPGGESIGFYSSLRLRTSKPEKIKEKRKIARKDVTRTIGVNTQIEVFKNSIWKPYRTADLTILFDYGIDDVRTNLQFIKTHTYNTVYCVGNQKLSNSMDEAISMVEADNLEYKLKEQVIDLWEEIENKFRSLRKSKI